MKVYRTELPGFRYAEAGKRFTCYLRSRWIRDRKCFALWNTSDFVRKCRGRFPLFALQERIRHRTTNA